MLNEEIAFNAVIRDKTNNRPFLSMLHSFVHFTASPKNIIFNWKIIEIRLMPQKSCRSISLPRSECLLFVPFPQSHSLSLSFALFFQ